jgi:hypothetical protein
MRMNTFARSLALTLIVFGTLATAGDQTAAAPTPEPTPAASPPTPAVTPTPDVEGQLEEFVPSEKVGAEQAVAFPVDI